LHHLKDWKLYCWAFLIFSAVVPGFSYNFYTPLILRQGMGFSASQSQLLTAPPFVFAAIITFLSSLISDKFHLRGPVLIVHHTLTITGMFITAYVKNPAARYFGVFLGTFSASAPRASI
jgi:MFS family permease